MSVIHASSLTDFLNQLGYKEFEGYSQQCPEQVKRLIELTAKPNIRVMEIGFNAGHSAEVFLSNNPTLDLTSFDLGIHTYVLPAKQFIDAAFPGRHTLILGDSTKSLPKFIRDYPNTKYDVIFIDGGHDYPIAYSDLTHCMQLAHSNTIVILDDVVYTPELEAEWTKGPKQSWDEYKESDKIIQKGAEEYGLGRGMTWGKYNFNRCLQSCKCHTTD